MSSYTTGKKMSETLVDTSQLMVYKLHKSTTKQSRFHTRFCNYLHTGNRGGWFRITCRKYNYFSTFLSTMDFHLYKPTKAGQGHISTLSYTNRWKVFTTIQGSPSVPWNYGIYLSKETSSIEIVMRSACGAFRSLPILNAPGHVLAPDWLAVRWSSDGSLGALGH